ncbi:MAG: hypothetical protein JNK82_44555 [Myxococcaceae bacterium]|nr:hypothetical protein [Myxococcaceae bacterium]
MTRMLIAVLSLSVLGYLAYRTLYGRQAVVGGEEPQQQLQNVRDVAKGLEEKGEQRVDDIDKKTQER